MISNPTITDRQSTLIQAMRFLLIVLVLFVHSPGAFSSTRIEWGFEGWNIYHFVSAMISQNFCAIANCWFFTFSGYLFFNNSENFGSTWIIQKWKKRIHSLLIPFILWNILMIVCIVLKSIVFDYLQINSDATEWEIVRKGPIYWFITGPADYPLWFLRDLIIMTLFTPLLYVLIKRAGYYSLLIFGIMYVVPWGPKMPSILAIFYFFIGSWMRINNINILSISRKYRTASIIGTFVLLLLATSQIGRPFHWLFLRFFIPFGMFFFMNLCDGIINHPYYRRILCKLSSTVFFIYAIHEIYILGWTKGLFLRLFGTSLPATWTAYLFVPLVTLILCLALFYGFYSICPQAMAIACGKRINTNKVELPIKRK